MSESMRGRAKARPGAGGKPAAPPLEYSLLLTATLCLLAFGAVMVFSASSARSLLNTRRQRLLLPGAHPGLRRDRPGGDAGRRRFAGSRAVKPLTPLILGVSLFFLLSRCCCPASASR